jgi:hypothetical protein
LVSSTNISMGTIKTISYIPLRFEHIVQFLLSALPNICKLVTLQRLCFILLDWRRRGGFVGFLQKKTCTGAFYRAPSKQIIVLFYASISKE